jgi:DNA invertase Pin-like site-specific DNA recombinase
MKVIGYLRVSTTDQDTEKNKSDRVLKIAHHIRKLKTKN